MILWGKKIDKIPNVVRIHTHTHTDMTSFAVTLHCVCSQTAVFYTNWKNALNFMVWRVEKNPQPDP